MPRLVRFNIINLIYNSSSFRNECCTLLFFHSDEAVHAPMMTNCCNVGICHVWPVRIMRARGTMVRVWKYMGPRFFYSITLIIIKEGKKSIECKIIHLKKSPRIGIFYEWLIIIERKMLNIVVTCKDSHVFL